MTFVVNFKVYATNNEQNDFSKAQFELKKSGERFVKLEITGIHKEEGKYYKLYITSDSNSPNIENNTDNEYYLDYISSENKFVVDDIAKTYEMNQDLYATLTEDDTIVTYGNKLTRFEEPNDNNAFANNTRIEDNRIKIITNFSHDSNNFRKMKVKIGKVTDVAILQKIKNNDSNGFSELMNFAKNNIGFFDQNLNCIQTTNIEVDYNTNIKSNLEIGSYYYLYVKTDDENGKYVSNEAVTLGCCENDSMMYLLGSNNFTWNLDGVSSTNDPSVTQTNSTDFSKATFELKKDVQLAKIEITNASLINDNKSHSRYVFITSNDKMPDISNLAKDEKIYLNYRTDEKKFITASSFELADKIEKNQDLYLNIVEDDILVLYGKKLTRFEEPKYSDAFFATGITESNTQILSNFTYSSKNDRKLRVKIGKITDMSILKKIKNKDSTGFADLLNFAKNNSGMYNNVLSSNTKGRIGYDSNNIKNNVIKLSGMENNCYYYLYIQTDDENGKYISNEAVTFGVNVSLDSYNISFYEKSNFNWTDFNNISDGGDNNSIKGSVPEKLPYAGIKSLILTAIVGVSFVGIISRMKYQKYKDI